MLLVGLTGGIASGKSTVSRMFEREGGYIIDLDAISRRVVEPGRPGWQEVVNLFGREIVNKDQTLNRKTLGNIVFADHQKRRELEKILHPKIYEEENHQIGKIVKDDVKAIVILDIPLLIEVGRHATVDKVVLVYGSSRVQIKRLRERDRLGLEDARRRLSSQMDIDSKLRYAHYVINNEGTLKKTEETVKEVFQKLKKAEALKRTEGRSKVNT